MDDWKPYYKMMSIAAAIAVAVAIFFQSFWAGFGVFFGVGFWGMMIVSFFLPAKKLTREEEEATDQAFDQYW
jgi:uncharacterized protein (DUF58 family)